MVSRLPRRPRGADATFAGGRRYSRGGLLLAVMGLLADLISSNRRLLEELVWREKVATQGLLHFTEDQGLYGSKYTEVFDSPAEEVVAEEVASGGGRV